MPAGITHPPSHRRHGYGATRTGSYPPFHPAGTTILGRWAHPTKRSRSCSKQEFCAYQLQTTHLNAVSRRSALQELENCAGAGNLSEDPYPPADRSRRELPLQTRGSTRPVATPIPGSYPPERFQRGYISLGEIGKRAIKNIRARGGRVSGRRAGQRAADGAGGGCEFVCNTQTV
jgi:hypothetical protein